MSGSCLTEMPGSSLIFGRSGETEDADDEALEDRFLLCFFFFFFLAFFFFFLFASSSSSSVSSFSDAS